MNLFGKKDEPVTDTKAVEVEQPVEEVKAEAPATKTIEDMMKEKGTDPAIFAAVKLVKRWGIGKQVSSSEFDAAVTEILGLKIVSEVP